jgi:hypothetical protein
MLLESKRVRGWLNETIMGGASVEPEEPSNTASFNPMPALIIYLLGSMMGGHQQQQMVSTMVHRQWGGLLAGAALARGVTYIITYVRRPTSYLPSRPPSELVGAFCLISGGLIFMLSVSFGFWISNLSVTFADWEKFRVRPPISWTSWFTMTWMPCSLSTSPSASAVSSWHGR